MFFALTSCKAKPKTFSKNGITVTLNSKFHEVSNDSLDIYCLSTEYGFAGNAQSKSNFSGYNLEKYTNNVANQANKLNSSIQLYQEGENTFRYFYYEATVDGNEFSYMGICKEGKNDYYTLNFWSYKKDFEKVKDQFMEWAKTIEVN